MAFLSARTGTGRRLVYHANGFEENFLCDTIQKNKMEVQSQ